MATLKSTLFFAAAFGSFLFSDLHAQDQEPRDYLSIQPYGSYHNYFMEGEYNSRPCFGGGIKLGRTIIHLVHVELGLEYVQKRYTQTVTYTTAPSGLPKNFTYQCKVDYYNIPILFNISIIPHAGENQRMYFTSGFLLLNARNLYIWG